MWFWSWVDPRMNPVMSCVTWGRPPHRPGISFFICKMGVWLHAVLRLWGAETDSLDVTAASLLLPVTGCLPVMLHIWEGVALLLDIQMCPEESSIRTARRGPSNYMTLFS